MAISITIVVVLIVAAVVATYFLLTRRSGASAGASSESTDVDLPPGVVSDESARAGLPPSAGTRGEGEIAGVTREAAPYDDAPADGKFAPGADNPPPGS